jgi:hypothetical protein
VSNANAWWLVLLASCSPVMVCAQPCAHLHGTSPLTLARHHATLNPCTTGVRTRADMQKVMCVCGTCMSKSDAQVWGLEDFVEVHARGGQVPAVDAHTRGKVLRQQHKKAERFVRTCLKASTQLDAPADEVRRHVLTVCLQCVCVCVCVCVSEWRT